MTTTLRRTFSPEVSAGYARLGAIVLREAGEEACQAGYGTTDPEWVGRYAIYYGDIQPDGTMT
jgi:hypothetical protein